MIYHDCSIGIGRCCCADGFARETNIMVIRRKTLFDSFLVVVYVVNYDGVG